MRVETGVFSAIAFFFVPVSLIYGWLSEWEPVGTAALLLTGGLAAMIAAYLWTTSRRIDPRPEDNPQGLIEEGAGEQGFYSPHSWWPLPLGFAAAVAFLGVAIGWWLFIIGCAIGVVALIGWTYEYYRGAHAH